MAWVTKTSDRFTNAAGNISGNSLDLGLGGSAATWALDDGNGAVGSGIATLASGAAESHVHVSGTGEVDQAVSGIIVGAPTGWSLCFRYTDKNNHAFIEVDGNGRLRVYVRTTGTDALITFTSNGAVAQGDTVLVRSLIGGTANHFEVLGNGVVLLADVDCSTAPASGTTAIRGTSTDKFDDFLYQIQGSSSSVVLVSGVQQPPVVPPAQSPPWVGIEKRLP